MKEEKTPNVKVLFLRAGLSRGSGESQSSEERLIHQRREQKTNDCAPRPGHINASFYDRLHAVPMFPPVFSNCYGFLGFDVLQNCILAVLCFVLHSGRFEKNVEVSSFASRRYPPLRVCVMHHCRELPLRAQFAVRQRPVSPMAVQTKGRLSDVPRTPLLCTDL